MSKIKTFWKFIPYIFKSIWFNFSNLPFKQAVKMPILLYKPTRLKSKGIIKIEAENISTGMIKLGGPMVSIYPNTGISIENMGGVIFKGRCTIGNNSFISIAPTGTVVFGENFLATSSLKLVCYKKITFGKNVLVGWENLFCDTDFHAVKVRDTSEKKLSYAPINIGSNNWFAMKSIVLKGTKTPDFTIIGTNSFLSKDYSDLKEYSLIAGQPAKFVKGNVYRDLSDDKIDYR